MHHKRLLLALVLSSAILLLWSYFFPPVKPPQTAQPGASPSPTAQASVSPETQTQAVNASPTAAPPPQVANIPAAPKRTITIITPLYKAVFDTQGAEPVSWIIIKNRNSQAPIFSVKGKKEDKVPLELISPEGLQRQPRLVPLQLQTGDASVDELLRATTYRVEGVDTPEGDVTINLTHSEKKELTFVLDDPSQVQIRKTIVFDAERYETDLVVSLKRGEQVIPQVKVAIGPSIGDQGIGYHTFYSVAPEAVAVVNNRVERHLAASINGNSSSPDKLVLNGPTDWGGVADTYFGMVAIPPKQTEGLEYRTTAYEYKQNGGTPEKRFLITAYVPIPSDGSRSVLYAGPKDHYLLEESSTHVSQVVERPVDLDGLIDYGYLAWLSRPLAVPILQAITYLFEATGSYGVAIILFTIVIYSLFFPLKWRSSKAMKKAAKLAPKMKELQEKIKGLKQNDPRLKELQMEQLRLMKEGNPLGGCLPLLIQMPFLFALYRAITISLDFRQASFLWIPDLSAAEPYLIHVLPILMTGTMVVLQLVTPAPSADPLQRKMMAIGMPLFMLYILWSAPSGLVLYWLVGNIVGFSQQFLINHWTKSDDDKVPEPPAKGPPARKKRQDPVPSGS
ncbi:MAG TPA: membrane protein insertase YidC [Pyrinomonadaceae bacterium]|nr:membrane protein insertase YidC [Pyrinomonadaceae bacterium]